VQLEINEQFLSLATSLPATGQKWSKNYKIRDVPWTLFFQSQMVNSCDKVFPTNMLKQCFHDLLMIIKQFITCEILRDIRLVNENNVLCCKKGL
jgi:hypothetical protein